MSVIAVEHVTKEFQLGQLQGMREGLRNLVARARGRAVTRRHTFRALDDVNFSIEPGEIVGIIGHNGAGKSTLLKLLSRITVPTSGTVRVQGRVAPLIEVGAGLMGELTGRENIYLNGTILGMSRAEIRRKFDEIVAFAELERFIDTPLKRYSSGMQIKLGFSVATSVESEVLLIDEVLAVGDVAFQRKCFERIDGLINRGDRTILIVGHNVRQIERMCNRVILLDRGKVVMDGEPSVVCSEFLDAMQSRINAEQLSRLSKIGAEFSSGQLDVVGVTIRSADDEIPSRSLASHTPLSVRIDLQVHQPLPDIEFVVGVHTPDLLYVTESSSAVQGVRPTLAPGLHSVECRFSDNVLRGGVYGIGLAIHDKLGRGIWRGDNLTPFEVVTDEVPEGATQVRGLVDLNCRWQSSGSSPAAVEARQVSERIA